MDYFKTNMFPKGVNYLKNISFTGGGIILRTRPSRGNDFKNISPKGGIMVSTYLQGGDYCHNVYPKGGTFPKHFRPGGGDLKDISPKGGIILKTCPQMAGKTLRTFYPRRELFRKHVPKGWEIF